MKVAQAEEPSATPNSQIIPKGPILGLLQQNELWNAKLS
jgi:hypothetical protein